MKKLLIIVTMILVNNTQAESTGKCVGRFLNPVTDVCWSCMFPITIAGLRVSPSNEDTPNPKQLVCRCNKPVIRFGIPITFWEPVRIIEITRIKFCLVSMGGIKIGPNSIKGHGSTSSCERLNPAKTSFYQAHYYVYPLLHVFNLLADFGCMEKVGIDIPYITEIDPMWNDDETAFVLNPEVLLFANPIAQATCVMDSLAAMKGFPLNSLFWCSGSQGSIYPFTGHVPTHIGGVQASLLLVSRMLAKMHREGLATCTFGTDAMCDHSPICPVIMKDQYKQQMIYPVATSGKGGCRPLGRSSVLWESGKEKPYTNEDFSYLIWRKRSCCLL